MSSDLTPFLNELNVNSVRKQINRKKASSPYYATNSQSAEVITDHDTFPYPRYYQGIPKSNVPIIAEREAGWRPRHDDCYKLNTPSHQLQYPNNCFQAACSTVYPCYPANASSEAADALALILNKTCVVQYR
jgi:hypothetical protein